MQPKKDLVILIVDDSPVSIKLLETMLRKEGYAVVTAKDGPTGKRLAMEVMPDLVLLDIMMPGEDGFEVMKGLKKNARCATVPIIFLTGRDDMEAKLAGFELGAVDYITKPFHAPEVLARVRLHLKLSLATNSLIADQAYRLKQLEQAQTSMLTTPDDLPAARFSVHYSALHEAGGDFYDVFQISEDVFGYFVADVSGHDIATSFITAAVKALLKQNCTPIYSPVESMRMINDVLVEILPDGIYLTACYANLNRNKNLLSIVNAGHPPVVYQPKGGESRSVDVAGDVLGIFNEVCYAHENIEVDTGDRFFLYTDGLVERPADRRLWATCLPELLAACDKLKDVPVHESASKLLKELTNGGRVPEDDIVVLGVEV